MKTFTRIGLVALLLAVVAPLTTWTQTSTEGWSLEQSLPADTLFYMTATNTPEVHAAFEKTSLYQLTQNEEVREFFKPFAQKKDMLVKMMDTRLQGFGGLTVEKITDLLRHTTMSLAVIPSEPEAKPDVVLAFVPNERSEQFSTALTGLKEGLKSLDESFVEVEHEFKGTKYMELGREDHSDRVYTAVMDKIFLFTNNEERLQAILSREPVKPSLKSNTAFAAVQGKIAPAQKTALFAYLNIQEALRMGADEVDREDMDTLGITGMQAVGGSISFQGDNIKESYYLHTTGEKKGLTKLFALKPVSKTAWSTIPPHALAAFSMNLDVQETLKVLPALLKVGGGVGTSANRKQLREFTKKTRDLFAALGSQVTFYAATPEAGGVIPGCVWGVDLKDEAKFRAALATLVPDKTQWESMTHNGEKIEYTYFKVRPHGETLSVPFCYTIHNQTLFIALSPQTLKRHINFLKASGAGSLQESDSFKHVAGQIPQDAGLVGYLKTGQIAASLYNSLLPILNFMKHDLAKKSQGMFDPAKLPLGETLARYLKESTYSLTSEADGIRVETMNWPSCGLFGYLFLMTAF